MSLISWPYGNPRRAERGAVESCISFSGTQCMRGAIVNGISFSGPQCILMSLSGWPYAGHMEIRAALCAARF
eukprot:10421639-Karenia_brevis.AAC.1